MNQNDKQRKKKILIFSEYYLPGYKSGGGMRTIVNIVAALYHAFDFYIVTNDHDGRSDKTPYSTVKINDWNDVENAKVFYLDQKQISFAKILELFRTVEPDILYSNSYFSRFNIYLLVLNGLGKLKNTSYLISPCGELSEGAMKVSLGKKKKFISVANLLDLHRRIIWKATHETEKNEILHRLDVRPELIHIAPDITHVPNAKMFSVELKPEKKAGEVKFVFLSRFSEKKNFKYFLEVLSDIEGNINVDIFGPIDDMKYWQECSKVIEKLPENVKVERKGAVPHDKVGDILLGYHFFAMPTLGENFGHAFLEALTAGCPLVISDRTPWLNLAENEVGWDIPLEDPGAWKEAVKSCVAMNEREFERLSKNANDFANRWRKKNDFVEATRNLLQNA